MLALDALFTASQFTSKMHSSILYHSPLPPANPKPHKRALREETIIWDSLICSLWEGKVHRVNESLVNWMVPRWLSHRD